MVDYTEYASCIFMDMLLTCAKHTHFGRVTVALASVTSPAAADSFRVPMSILMRVSSTTEKFVKVY